MRARCRSPYSRNCRLLHILACFSFQPLYGRPSSVSRPSLFYSFMMELATHRVLPYASRLLFGSPVSSTVSGLPAFRSWSLSASISIPTISWHLPGLVSDIWEGILKAVPKKKTSHSKRRHRQLAGKALKDVRAINTCPGCGRPKKAHTLCPYCVAGKYAKRNRKNPSLMFNARNQGIMEAFIRHYRDDNHNRICHKVKNKPQ